MEVTIKKFPVWFWQLKKINELRKKYCNGFLGWYAYTFEGRKQTEAKITLIAVRPLLWRWVLIHEKGHHKITSVCRSLNGANKRNIEYDKVTRHGLFQWRWK